MTWSRARKSYQRSSEFERISGSCASLPGRGAAGVVEGGRCQECLAATSDTTRDKSLARRITSTPGNQCKRACPDFLRSISVVCQQL